MRAPVGEPIARVRPRIAAITQV